MDCSGIEDAPQIQFVTYRDGELLEQTADNAAHQQERDEHRDERNADRQNREADFARALQCGMQGLGATGALEPRYFFAGTSAHDADDHIVYDKVTGALFYDSNGNVAGGVTSRLLLNAKCQPNVSMRAE